uniref:T-complex 11 n=1 Tax=Myotis myotis TaxID=51298 RepID=A0A7J7WXP9_MYOMY|nr:t-complex 11 [Myotis myotis]
MMTLLCAPVRDEAVQRLDGITDSALLLRGIFQVLGLMKMDMRNYTLQSRQPHLREHAILHERAQFQERLSRQPGLLDHTAKWLSRAAADLRPVPDAPASSGAGPSPSEAASGPEPLSPAVVLSQAFLNLLLWDPDHDEEFPEGAAAGAGGAAAPPHRPGLRPAGGQQLLRQRPVRLPAVRGQAEAHRPRPHRGVRFQAPGGHADCERAGVSGDPPKPQEHGPRSSEQRQHSLSDGTAPGHCPRAELCPQRHRSADPPVSQMLPGSRSAALSARPPRGPHSH